MEKFTATELNLFDALLTITFDDEFIDGIMCVCDFEDDKKDLTEFIDRDGKVTCSDVLYRARILSYERIGY